MIGILWGLLGAFFIGISDGIARKTTQQISVLVLVLFVLGISSVFLNIVFWLYDLWPSWHAYAWFASLISGALNLVALAFLYSAIRRGPVAVAAPIASSFTIILVIINGFMGHPFLVNHLLGVGLVFVGAVMLTRPEKVVAQQDYSSQWLRGTAYLALAAALAISLRFFLAQEASDIIGSMQSLYLNRLFAALVTLLALIVMAFYQGKPAMPKGSIWWLVIAQAIFESLALWAFLTGSTMGGRVTATIGFSAFAAITTFIVWLFFDEKVPAKRWLWISLIALGILLASQ